MGHVPAGQAFAQVAVPFQRLHDAGSSLADRRRVCFGGSNHGLGAGVAGKAEN